MKLKNNFINFLKSIIGPLQIKLLRKILEFSKYRLVINPASDSSFTRYLISRDFRKLPNNEPIQFYNWQTHKVYFQKNDLRGSMSLFKNSYLEYSIIYSLFYFCKKLKTKCKDVISFDIGANYGTYSLGLKELNIPIVLVEPNPFIAKCLSLSFPKSTIFKNALVPKLNKNKNISINIIPESSGSSSLLDINKCIKNKISTKHKQYIEALSMMTFALDVETIDPVNLFKSYQQYSTAFIKLDIEGVEIDLFKNKFIDEIQERFERFVILTEFLGYLLNNSDKDFMISLLGKFPCLILSSSNNKKQFLEYQNKSFSEIYDQGYDFSNFFKSSLIQNPEELRKALLNSNDQADILVFSDNNLANLLIN